MRKIISMLTLLAGFALTMGMFATFTGCEKSADSIIGPGGPVLGDLSIVVTEEDNNQLVSDSAYVFQNLVFMARTTLPNPYRFLWNYGNSVLDSGQGTRYKYTVPGTYNITLTIYYGSGQSQTTQIQLRIVSGTSSAKPIVKSLGSIYNGNGTWTVTYGLLRREIYCGTTQPFIVFSEITGWNPVNLSISDTTADGYYKYTEVVGNSAVRKFSYGGNFAAGCYAWMEPHLPSASNIYWLADEAKNGIYWLQGVANTVGSVNNNLPGYTGDLGLNPTFRIGWSQNNDTLHFYYGKSRLPNPTNPSYVNNITGMNSVISLANSNWSDFWIERILFSSLPPSMVHQSQYGNNNGGILSPLADMTQSFAYIASLNLLEVRLVSNRPGGGWAIAQSEAEARYMQQYFADAFRFKSNK